MVALGAAVAALAVTASLAAAAPAPTPACDLVAASGGADENPGTVEKPFRTVQALIDDPSPGRTRCLRGGTYDQWAEESNGQLSFTAGGARGDPLRLQSYPGERARILGVLSLPKTIAHVELSDLEIDGSHATDAGVTVQVQADDVTLIRDDVTNGRSGESCVAFGRAGSATATGAVVRDSRLHGCGVDPLHDHGVYVESTKGAVVAGNRIYGNAGWGVHMYPDAQNSVIAYNAIDGNGRGVLFGGQAPLASNGNVVEHNAISRSTLGHNLESYWGDLLIGTDNVARENCLGGAVGDDIASPIVGFTVDGNVMADPKYEDDFRVAADSACRHVLEPATPVAPDAATVRGSVGWTASPFAMGYVLQHRDGDDPDWTTAATVAAPRAAVSETDGTWRYRVIALGTLADSGASPSSAGVKVDHVAPSPPSIAAARAPESAPWFKDRVTLRVRAGADPPLPDGTAGSGIAPATVPGSISASRDGRFTATATNADRAGNVSAPATRTAWVDAEPPVVSLAGCPFAVGRHSAVSLAIRAADAGSGLALDPAGSLALDTEAAGPQVATTAARDRVGHETVARCAFSVLTIDFNGDGVTDRVRGVPRRAVRGRARAGVVLVRYGGIATRRIDQSRAGGRAERGDRFGAAIAAGDFDGDGLTDLAVGAPREDLRGRPDAGAVNVLYGTRHGLRRGRQLSAGRPRGGARFGAALSMRDVDGDGFDDLAVRRRVLHGSPAGLVQPRTPR